MCRTGLEGGKGERFYFPGLASICKCSDISPLFLSSHLGKMMNKDHVSPTNAGIPFPEKERLLLQEGQRGSGQQVEVLKISKQIDWK